MAFFQEQPLDKYGEAIKAFGDVAGKLINNILVTRQLKPMLTTQAYEEAVGKGMTDIPDDYLAGRLGKMFDPKTAKRLREMGNAGVEGSPNFVGPPSPKPDATTTSTDTSQSWGRSTGALLSPGNLIQTLIAKDDKVTLEDRTPNDPGQPVPLPGKPPDSTSNVTIPLFNKTHNTGLFYNKAMTDTNLVESLNRAATSVGVNPDQFALLAEQESGFNPRAVGKAGELGMFQIMPDNLRRVGVKLDTPQDAEAYLANVPLQIETAKKWIELNKAQFGDRFVNEPYLLAQVWNGGNQASNIPDETKRANVARYTAQYVHRLNALEYLRKGSVTVKGQQYVLRPGADINDFTGNNWVLRGTQ